MATKAKKAPAKKAAKAEAPAATRNGFRAAPGGGPHAEALAKAMKGFETGTAFGAALGLPQQSMSRAWSLGQVPQHAVIKLAYYSKMKPHALDPVNYPGASWTLPKDFTPATA